MRLRIELLELGSNSGLFKWPDLNLDQLWALSKKTQLDFNYWVIQLVTHGQTGSLSAQTGLSNVNHELRGVRNAFNKK